MTSTSRPRERLQLFLAGVGLGLLVSTFVVFIVTDYFRMPEERLARELVEAEDAHDRCSRGKDARQAAARSLGIPVEQLDAAALRLKVLKVEHPTAYQVVHEALGTIKGGTLKLFDLTDDSGKLSPLGAKAQAATEAAEAACADTALRVKAARHAYELRRPEKARDQ
jgi:hypothetical protein